MKNFIEVGKTEDEQAEQIKKWLRENGPQIVAGIVLGLSAIWGFDYYKNYQFEQSIEARTHYLSIKNNPDNASQTLAILQDSHADSAYTQQAILMMAKHEIDRGNYQQGLNYLLPLTNHEHTLIAHNAKLRAANIYLQMQNYDQALSILTDTDNTTFNALYNNTKGDIYLEKGDIDSAKKHYQLSLEQLPNSSDLNNLIRIKLNDLN